VSRRSLTAYFELAIWSVVMEKPDYGGKSEVELLGFLNLSAIINDAAAKTVSMAVLLGAKE
jgi:hypothetical protein